MQARVCAALLGLALLAGVAAGQEGGAEDSAGAPPAATAVADRERADALYQEAATLLASGRAAEAVPKAAECVAMLRRVKADDFDVACALCQLANCYGEAGRYVEALPANAEALATIRRARPEDDANVANVLRNSATAFFMAGRLEDAEAHFSEALSMYRRLFGDHATVVDALAQMANTRRVLGRPSTAVAPAEEALSLARRLNGEEHPDVAYCMGVLGAIYHALGRLGDAVELNRQCLALARKVHRGDHPEVVMALLSVAQNMSEADTEDEAIPLKEEARAMASRLFGDAHPQYGRALSDLASGLCRVGRQAEALPMYEEVLALWRRQAPGDHHEVAAALSSLGYALDAVGRSDEALPRFREAVAMSRRLFGNTSHSLALSLNNLGYALHAAGSRDDAIATYEEALAVIGRSPPGDYQWVPITRQNLASLLADCGRTQEALRISEEVLAILRRVHGGEHRDMVNCLGVLASCSASLGRHGESLAYLREAVAVSERTGSPESYHPLSQLGYALYRRGALTESAEHLERAMAAVEGARDTARTLGAADRVRFMDRVRSTDPFSMLVRVRIGLGDCERALSALERGRGRELQDLLQHGRGAPRVAAEKRARASGDSAELERISRARDAVTTATEALIRGERAEAEIRLGKDGDAVKAAVAEVSRARRALLDAHAAEARVLSDSSPSTRTATPDEIRAALAEDERMVFYEFDADDGFALLLGPGAGPVRAFPLRDGEKPLSSTRLDAWIPEVLATLASSGKSDTKSLSALFSALVPSELWKEIHGASRVYLVGHGSTHALPFEALVVGETGGRPIYWLDDGPPVAYAASGSVLAWLRSRRDAQGAEDPASLLAVGDAEFGGRKEVAGADLRGGTVKRNALAPLPGTRLEVEAIRRVFAKRKATATVLLGKEATEKRLHDAAGTGPRYMHLATHGIADETMMASFSFLALTTPAVPVPGDDGALTLLDLLGRWGRRLEHTGMVVLSACDTQKGKVQRHEGVVALPWGFHFAGCPTVVATLWRVSDETTPGLMAEFYGRLLEKDGKGRLEALLAAKRSLRKSHPDPFHWAPFVLLGDPR